MSTPLTSSNPSRPFARATPASWKAYAQLVRLPNVFTAMADIGLGAFAAWATAGDVNGSRLVQLLLASCAFYASGMVWNDFFDWKQDQRERPFRPIPSGRITRRAAAALGLILMGIGLALCIAVGPASLQVGLLLVLAIFTYDGLLKRTAVGPLIMGSCRLLNVLLGVTISARTGFPGITEFYLAGIVGLYTSGITWFAKTEATASNRSVLSGAACIMGLALLLALPLPIIFEQSRSSSLLPYLLVAMGFWVGIPVSNAIRNPVPSRVQAAVKRAIFSLVVLDAILATVFVGIWGLLLLLLLVPAMYLGRWIYST